MAERSNTWRRILMYAAVGAVVGTLIGVGLVLADVIDNPFWLTGVGIFLGSLATEYPSTSSNKTPD